MTAAELREILLSADFKTGLEELSSFLASITQEHAIVHLLAKCLWRQKHVYALERNKRHDLTVWAPTLSVNSETNMECLCGALKPVLSANLPNSSRSLTAHVS